MTRLYHKAAAVLLAAIFALLIVYAGPPMFPEQIYGAVTKSGASVPDGNLITVSTSDSSYTKTTLTKDGKYGWDPVFTIPVQSEDSLGAPLDSRLTFYVNGNLIFNKSFEPGSTSNVNIQVSGPICGLGGCEAGEDCLRCRNDCACQNTPLQTLRNVNDFFTGDVPGFSISLDTNLTSNSLSLASDGVLTAVIPVAASLDRFNLSKIKMTRGAFGNRNYAIANYDGEKTVFVGKSSGSNAVCVKDALVASIAEISENCTSSNEYRVNCTGGSFSGFRCTDLGITYKVTGLTHSAVIEIPLFVYALTTGTTTSITSVSTDATTVTSSSTSGTTTRHSKSNLGYQSMSTKTNGTLKPDVPYVCKPSWSCTQYDRCQPSGKQFRICTDSAKCGTLEAKPAVEQACQYVAAYVPPIYQPPYVPPIENPTPPQEPAYQAPTIPVYTEPAREPIVEQPKQYTPMIWLYAILGIAVLTGIVVVVLYTRQSSTEASQEAIEYIHTMRYNGYEEPVIRTILDQQQWKEKDISSAFDAYHKRYG